MADNNMAQAGGKNKLKLPSDKTLKQATLLSIKHTKPVCFYFFVDSLKNNVCIASDGDDRVIFKNEDEHTSPILKTYSSESEYIVITENTIYIISSNTKINK